MNYSEISTNAPVDFAQLLDGCGNEIDVALTQVCTFASEVSTFVDELQTALEQQNLDAIVVVAGAIRNAAAMTSANLISEVAAEIESAGQAEDYTGAVMAFDELQTQVIRMQEWLQNTSGADFA